MTEANQMPSGQPSEDSVNHSGSDEQAKDSSKDSVQYETYRKVLSEKKKRDEEILEAKRRLEEYERKEKEREDRELVEANKWQEYAKKKEEEAKTAFEKVKAYEEREIASRKLDRVLSGVGDPIDSKYWGLINIDAVSYDAESGEFDEQSLNSEIQRIKTQMPEIISRQKNANFDPSAPVKNGSSQLDIQKFASMSKQDKKANIDKLQNVPDWMRGKF